VPRFTACWLSSPADAFSSWPCPSPVVWFYARTMPRIAVNGPAPPFSPEFFGDEVAAYD
jgi:hypothetical protein